MFCSAIMHCFGVFRPHPGPVYFETGRNCKTKQCKTERMFWFSREFPWSLGKSFCSGLVRLNSVVTKRRAVGVHYGGVDGCDAGTQSNPMIQGNAKIERKMILIMKRLISHVGGKCLKKEGEKCPCTTKGSSRGSSHSFIHCNGATAAEGRPHRTERGPPRLGIL